jgi:transcriptional antiterminator RfaH
MMSIETATDERQWYVVHTKPKEEERANSNLVAWGVETLHAKLRTCRYNEFTGAPTYLTRPLFPRYIFAKFASKELFKILFTRGVHNVVCFGDGPACVSEEVINIIRARIDEHGFVKVNNDLKPGDKVIVSAGSLKNLIGIFERKVKGNERIMIMLDAIEFQGRLVVNRDLVKRAG